MCSSRNLPEVCRKYVDQFGAHPSAEVARLELARQLIVRQQLLDAELQLLNLQSSDNPRIAGEATALLATMLSDVGKTEAAAICYLDLERRFGDVTCLDNKTGLQLAEEARRSQSMKAEMDDEIVWPTGKYEVQASEAEPSRGFLSGTTLAPIERIAIAGPLPRGTELLYDQRMNAVVIRDEFGKVEQRVVLGDQNKFSTSTPSFAQFVANGHLLLVSLGFEVIAIDMLGNTAGQEDVVWRRDLSSSSSADGSRRRLSHRSVTRPWVPLGTSCRNPLDCLSA